MGGGTMAEAQSNHITDEHYAAFGRIVNTMAEIDAVLDGIIVAMAKGTMEVLPLLPMVSSKSKGDYILAMGKEGLSPELIQELEKLMDRVRTAHVLRDQIAHCIWTWGTKPGKIKPCVMSARTVLKMRGTEPNEKQWTADELNAEAQRIGTRFSWLHEKRWPYPPVCDPAGSKLTVPSIVSKRPGWRTDRAGRGRLVPTGAASQRT